MVNLTPKEEKQQSRQHSQHQQQPPQQNLSTIRMISPSKRVLAVLTFAYVMTVSSRVLAFAAKNPSLLNSSYAVKRGKAMFSAFSGFCRVQRQNDLSRPSLGSGKIDSTSIRRQCDSVRCFNSMYSSEGDGKQQQQQQRRSATSLSSTTAAIDIQTATTPTTEATKVLVDDSLFLKPTPDTRHYRSITLPSNSLQVLLVSDPKTDIEAASIHVKAGHFNDPRTRAGLAHFHEHMLFLGTKKYPEENEYETFLGTNGGSSNAYTDMEDTNYYFSVNPLNHKNNGEEEGDAENEADVEEGKVVSKALYGALDRFSQFFKHPLFDSSMMDRELRAINSEYINAITSDTWRNYALLKASCDADHSFSKFGCGNYNTLTNGGDMNMGKKEGSEENEAVVVEGGGGTIPRLEVVEFWKKHYVGKNMKLVVVGKAHLDELEKLVHECFSDVRGDSNDPSPFDDALEEMKHERQQLLFAGTANGATDKEMEEVTTATTAFGSSQLGIIREVIPVAEMRTLKLLFGFPPLDDAMMNDSKPHRVLSHLLGHESPGSLHSLLNEEGYINGLSSGVTLDVSDFSMFSITVSLTPKGMNERDKIIDLIFQYISLIKQSLPSPAASEEEKGGENHHTPVLKEYHDEIRRIGQINFDFSENGDPTSFASGMARRLFKYEENPQEILIGPILMENLDFDITQKLLELLHPSNALITITDPDAAAAIDVDSNDSSMYQDTDLMDSSWQQEKWYGAKYRQKEIDPQVMEKWASYGSGKLSIDSRLKLPELNKFIATDFSLRCDDDDNRDTDSITITSTNGDDTNVATTMPTPPKLLPQDLPGVRMHHKMDTTYRVPKTFIKIHLTSPNVYKSPRSMTLNRLYEKVLNDDLTSFVYDARLAGCHYRVACTPTGFRISLSGYSEKLTDLLDVLTSRMLSLAEEMLEGPAARPALYQMFQKAQQNLLRQTKNIRLDKPYSTAVYNSRLLFEDKIWNIQRYIDEMEEDAYNPLTMEECAKVAEECLFGRVKVRLCVYDFNAIEKQDGIYSKLMF
uniref:Peptidase M16 N-terminal domain-containing protein n=1 Tax=Ditylum brightwellii TaxID=49249 RepID=A0A7S4RX98_9STRA